MMTVPECTKIYVKMTCITYTCIRLFCSIWIIHLISTWASWNLLPLYQHFMNIQDICYPTGIFIFNSICLSTVYDGWGGGRAWFSKWASLASIKTVFSYPAVCKKENFHNTVHLTNIWSKHMNLTSSVTQGQSVTPSYLQC